MPYFVNKDSIVREIWGKADTILFIFAGSAAEFALNKAVDWLYYTGKLPADPLGRLFSTVEYARRIIFADLDSANQAIDQITAIHQSVETSRGATIPDWAYRDVLFMLIGYSISSYEALERKLTDAEKAEVFDVFYRVGVRMGLTGLPLTYPEWDIARDEHLDNNLIKSHYTTDLFKQYRKHLGLIRYLLLRQVQAIVSPTRVKKLLGLPEIAMALPALWLYKQSRKIKLGHALRDAMLPLKFKSQIKALDKIQL